MEPHEGRLQVVEYTGPWLPEDLPKPESYFKLGPPARHEVVWTCRSCFVVTRETQMTLASVEMRLRELGSTPACGDCGVSFEE